jgi:sugar lactone lactonase YvrE
MVRRWFVPMGGVVAAVAAAACHRQAVATPVSARVIARTAAGFSQPENVVYDSVADVFLVSNMGVGTPTARDDDGFISRVAPDGRVLALRWIAGGPAGATLDAPKGLAIRGDTLAVADVGAVHLFDRRSGAPFRSVHVDGVLLNDVAYGPDGVLWVTDTGPDRSTGTPDTTSDLDAIWRIDAHGQARAVARGLGLQRPDGIVVDGATVLVTTFGADRLERVAGRNGNWNVTATLPAGRLDGLRRLSDTSLVLTSWDAKAVWRRTADGRLTTLMSDVTSPAGVALDTRRHRLAVTSMQDGALYLVPLP